MSDRAFRAPATIAIIADTHIYPHGSRQLPGEVLDLFHRFSPAVIVHCGDINTESVLDQLGEVAPVIAVQGNNDEPRLRLSLPMSDTFQVGPFRFLVIHGHGGVSARTEAKRQADGFDCVIYGHSHIPKIESVGKTILFNPGSATDRRWQEHYGVGLMHVTENEFKPELVLFAHPAHLANIQP